MRNYFSNLLPIKSYTFFTALFVAVFLLYLGYGNSNFELVELKKIIISQATADGVSIKSRIDLFYGLLFKLVFLLLFNIPLFSFVFNRFHIQKRQQAVLLLLSSIGISILMLQVIGVQTVTLIYVLFFLLIYKIIIYGLANSKIRGFQAFKAEILSNSILAYGFLIYFGVLYLTGTTYFLWVYIFSVLILTLFFTLFLNYLKWSFRKVNYFFLPLVILSVLVFFSVELTILQYQKGLSILGLGYKKLYFFTFILFSLLFYLLVFLRKRSFKSLSFYYKRFIAPSVLIAFCLLLYYFPIVDQNTELFELGNPANAMMRIFKFGEIPFVDFMSSHLFAEQWYGIIYSLIFGYNNQLDFQIYFFFNRLLFLIVVYYFLNKLFKNPAYSLLFVIGFPFLTQVFSNDLVFCILPFFIIQKISKRSTPRLYFFLFASVLLLIIWKIDTGFAAMASSFFYFLILGVTHSLLINWKHLLKGFLITASVVISLLLFAILLRGGDFILNNFNAALHYVSGNQAHGYSDIAFNYPHQFYISYFFLPLIAVLLSLYIGYLLWKKEKLSRSSNKEILILHSSLFFFLISLVNAQRGIVRHGYAENNDGAIITTFYLAVALLFVFLWKKHMLKFRLTVFYVACFTLFLIFRFFPYQPEFGHFDQAIKKNSFIALDVDMAAETELLRTRPNHEFYANKIEDFNSFLEDNLTKEETFLDFSNTPMLYYYSGKKQPGYFCQNLQNSIDDYTQLHLLNDVNPKDVPIVVFSSYPESWFDKTDGIPNSMRYYWVAEYIYKNYKPYAIINEKCIWIANNFKVNTDYATQENEIPETLKEFNYKKTAHYIYDFYERNEFKKLEKVEDLKQESDHFTLLQKTVSSVSHAYVLIEFDTVFEKNTAKLILRDSLGNKLDLFKFEIDSKLGNKYMLRISNSKHWHNGNTAYFDVEKEQSIAVKSVTLYKDTRFEN